VSAIDRKKILKLIAWVTAITTKQTLSAKHAQSHLTAQSGHETHVRQISF